MKSFVLFIFLVLSRTFQAQINVNGDRSFAPLVAAYKAEFSTMVGYRIQICFDPNKSVVDDAKNKFLAVYPKTETYMTFDNPNFNLFVGDFRTQIAAERIKSKIQGDFTISVIHRTIIKLPRVD
jgi:accessory colonization factor AcfC